MTKGDLIEKVAFLQSMSSLSTKNTGSVKRALKPKAKDIEDVGKIKLPKTAKPEKPKPLPELKAPKSTTYTSTTLSKGSTGMAKSYSKFKGSALK